MKQLQKILLALFVWGVAAIGNSFAQSSADTTESNFITAARAYHTNKDMVVGFALRTNLLYDAFLLPTLGVEWRVNRNWGIKLDGSLSWWGSSSDKVQKVWLLNPEVRWYLLRNKRLYVGASGSYGEYNIYRYPLGNLFSKDTGYQGTLWSAGVTVGYQLCLSRKFSVDFNLVLGYTRSKYDSFSMTDGVRVSKERDKTKNFFGPTQAGINLVWTFGNNK